MKGIEVDLFTYNRDLEDLIITQYPLPFSDDQHSVDKDLDGKAYQFFNLKWAQLKPFLRERAPLLEYEVRNSKTGRIVKINGKING